jgi:hypothetical protein
MMVHVLLFWGPSLKESFKLALKNEQPDVHYQVGKTLFFRVVALSVHDIGDEEVQRGSMVVVYHAPCFVVYHRFFVCSLYTCT